MIDCEDFLSRFGWPEIFLSDILLPDLMSGFFWLFWVFVSCSDFFFVSSDSIIFFFDCGRCFVSLDYLFIWTVFFYYSLGISGRDTCLNIVGISFLTSWNYAGFWNFFSTNLWLASSLWWLINSFLPRFSWILTLYYVS